MKNILYLFLIALALGCNNNSNNQNPTPNVITPPALTTTEQALIGKWIWDKSEAYDMNGVLSKVSTPGSCITYNPDGTISMSAIPGSVTSYIPGYPPYTQTGYNGYTIDYAKMEFLNTINAAYDPAIVSTYNIHAFNFTYDSNGQYGGTAYWYLVPNYNGTGKEMLLNNAVLGGLYPTSCNGYIYTLSSTQLILRSNTNPSLMSTGITYWHKQ